MLEKLHPKGCSIDFGSACMLTAVARGVSDLESSVGGMHFLGNLINQPQVPMCSHSTTRASWRILPS